MTGSFFYYAESNIICAVIFGIMLFHDVFNADRQERQVKYDDTLIAFICYFISDTFWAAVEGGVLPATKLSVIIVNLSNFFILAAVTYLWLRFVMSFEQNPNREKQSYKILMLLPFLVSLAILVATFFAAPDLLVDDALRTRPFYDILQIIVPDVYVIAVLFYSLTIARREANPIERRRHLFVGLFPLIVVIGGLIQIVLIPDAPVFCFSCTILMLIFYIHSMETRISADPLTGLNNRGQLVKFISQESNYARAGRHTFVMMMDINDFKQINDTYGHYEGDQALIIVADALRSVARSHESPVFLARYGGDEFIMVLHVLDAAEIGVLVREVRDRIVFECSKKELRYSLTIGVGCDELKEPPDTFQKCIQRADKAMYLDKQQIKARGASTRQM